MKHIYIILLLVFQLTVIYSQENTIHVITRKIDKSYDFAGKNKLEIKAEKAEIRIQQWDKNIVSVELKLILKNRDLATAKKEMNYLKYGFSESGKSLLINNRVVLSSNSTDGLESNFKAEYTIYVPKNLSIDISNIFGKVTFIELAAGIKTNLEYCDLVVNNTSGNCYINSSIGDINLIDVRSDVEIISKYASIQFSNPGGNIAIKAEYGQVTGVFSARIKNIKITADKTNVTLVNKKCGENNLKLIANQGNIHLNNSCYIKNKTKLTTKKEGASQSYFYLPNSSQTGIEIETNYSDISLN